MRKAPIILLVVVLIVVGVAFVLKTCDTSGTQSKPVKAAYQVVADSRIYYTDSYTQGVDKYGEYYILENYWDYKGESQGWRHIDKSLYLSRRSYNKIDIIKQ